MSKVALSGNASGTGTLTIAAPNTNSDQTLTLPDATGTILTTATPGVPVNGPAFSASQSTALTVSSNTNTKVTLNTESFDTNSNFDTTLYRFTPTIAGYYQFSANLVVQGATNTSLSDISILRNGTAGLQGTLFYNAAASYTTMYCVATGLLYMNGSTDYVELFGRVIGAGTLTLSGGTLSGFLARSAT